MLDLILAAFHHILVLALFGFLFAEFFSVRPGMNGTSVRRLPALDVKYGVVSALVLIVGFSRAIFAAKGWDYYLHNVFFWAKIGTFVVIGLLSIPPTLTFARWRRLWKSPSEQEIAKVRRYMWMELALFPLLPIFAAVMARGRGLLG